MKNLFLVLFLLSFCFSNGQNDKIPAGIADIFYMQYPYATNIKVNKKWGTFKLDFIMKGEHYIAVYEKNEWRYTFMDYSYKRLPPKVKVGLAHAKYDEKNVEETMLIYLPGGYEEYRIKLIADSFNNRFIFLNENGKVIRGSSISVISK